MSAERRVEVIAEDVGFSEGPVISQATGSIVFVSASHQRLYEITDSGLATIAEAEGSFNGATEGPGGVFYATHIWGFKGVWGASERQVKSTGGIIACVPGEEPRWVTRDPVSPNDLCFGPDGYLYVTDPTRTRPVPPRSLPGGPTRNDGRLWRCDVVSGDADLLCSVDWYPNGIAFGREDDAVYVASTINQQIIRMPLEGYGVGRAEVFVQMTRGVPDGFAFDVEGNLILAAASLEPGVPGTIQTWSPDGKLLDLWVPDEFRWHSNVALSEDRTLYVTEGESERVWRVPDWPTAGLPLHPFRK